MVKHIVLFRLKEDLAQDEKESVMERFKTAIEALPAYIPAIRRIFVGLNMNPDEQWEICIDSEFDTPDDVKAYAAHPRHLAAASILEGYKQDRACTDYEYL